MEQVTQPFISVDINPQTIKGLCDALAAALASNGINVERSENGLHVSLAYILGNCERKILAQVAKRIAEHKLEAQVVGVEVLEGQTTGYDYVALSFEANNEFAAVSQEISEELSTRAFKGGFRSHLTLFRMKKGEAKFESVHSICKNSLLACAIEQTKVCGRAVSVFDCNYQKQLSVAV